MTTCIVMPTIPRRSASAAEVVRRLLPQANNMIVHLNGHTSVPTWARDKRIRTILHPDGTGPIVRISVVPESDHVFFVDDDLAYPPDYVSRSVAVLKRLGLGNAVCYHAANWPKGSKPVFALRQLAMYSTGIDFDLPVALMGSGTACFHRSDLLRIDRTAPRIFEYEDDVWISSSCARKGIRMTRAKTTKNWIVPLPAAYDAGALFKDAARNGYVNRDIAMAAAHKMGSWNLNSEIRKMGNDKAFWDAQYKATSGLRTVGFPSKSEAQNAAEYAIGAERFIEYLNADIPADRRASALEIGYGRGFYTKLLAQHGVKNYVGFDIAAPSGPALGTGFSYRQGDAGTAFDLGKKFDIAMAIDILFHITDEARFEAALDNLRRHVKPGGVIFVTGRTKHENLAEHVVHRDLARYQKRLGTLIAVSPWRDTAFLRFRVR